MVLASSVASAVIAVVSAFVAWRSYVVSRLSVAEARRAADAAEASAVASRLSAEADVRADLRARTPEIDVRLVERARHGAGDTSATYELVLHGPEDLASVRLNRPQTTNSVHYLVAEAGLTDFDHDVELGPLAIAQAARFALSVGPWASSEKLPDLRVTIDCMSHAGDLWRLEETLEPPRVRPAQVALPRRIR